MSNFVYDNTPLPAAKVDRYPVTQPTMQWSAEDAAVVFGALSDIRSILQAQPISVERFGVVGDGVTNDGPNLQIAINAAAAVASSGAYGAILDLPKGTFLTAQSLTVPNGVILRGVGSAATQIKLASGASVASLIGNASQNGTQEFFGLQGLLIDGNKAGGAVCSTAVVDCGSLFINSFIRDCVIQNGSGVGLHIWAGGDPGGMGPFYVVNTWSVNHTSHNVLIEEVAGNSGAAKGIVCVNLTSEHQGSNASAIYLKGLGKTGQWSFYNTHIEQGAGATGRTCITIDGVPRVRFHGVQLLGIAATVSEAVKITTAIQNVGIKIGPIDNDNLLTPVIRDLKNGVTVSAPTYNIDGDYVTPDATTRGGQRFVPDIVAGSKGLVAQDAFGVDRAWFDESGSLTGSSVAIGAGVNLRGDVTNNRPVAYIANAISGFTNSYWHEFPTGGGGVLQLKGSANGPVFQVGTDSSMFFYQPAMFQGAVTAQGSLLMTNEITTATLSANQNNFAPTGIANATTMIVNASAPVSITGIASPVAGKQLTVYNNSASSITLSNLSGSSSSANQIQGRSGTDTVLTTKTSAILFYSPSLLKWLVMGDSL